MVDILLLNNYGYKWNTINNIHFKGYFIIDDILFKGYDALKLLENLYSYEEFNRFVATLNGIFSIVIEKKEETWCAVDRARNFPIFISRNGSCISDNVEKIRETLGVKRDDIDIKNFAALMASRYIMFNNTVYTDILQLEMGQSVLIKGANVEFNYYYKHISNTTLSLTRKEALDKFEAILDRMFDRVILAIDNRPVVISLSGGYDSRYIACMLKKKGVENVVCYTYGKKTSIDVIRSQEVAYKLGYEWHCIEYTDELLLSMIDEEFYEYIDMSNTHDYITYLQNYLAVRELEKKGVFKKNSVFLTGLCGDMPSGNYIMKQEKLQKLELTSSSLANSMFVSIHHKYQMNDAIRQSIVNEIKDRIDNAGVELDSLQNYIKLNDYIETSAEHSRFFLHMNRIHEFYGYEFLLPLWDNEFLEFWYSVPYEFRIEQNLYEEYLMHKLAKGFSISLLKPRGETISWEMNKKRFKTKAKYFLGGIYAKIMYTCGIPIKRKLDINNFGYLGSIIYKKIKYKHAINYKKANFDTICSIFIYERRYGKEALKKVKKYIK